MFLIQRCHHLQEASVSWRKLVLIVVVVAVVVLLFALDLGRYLNLDWLKAQQEAIAAFQTAHPLATAVIFLVLYVAVAALSLPGAVWMTLAGGAIFGLWWGTLIVSFASSMGATLSFLGARFLLRDWVENRFRRHLATIDSGIACEGAFYLFTLRLVPVFPFFVINVLFGLTAMRTRTFYWVSQLGMLPATVVYVNAGTQLAKVDSLGDVVSPSLWFSFALLGLFPLGAKKVIAIIRRRRIHASER